MALLGYYVEGALQKEATCSDCFGKSNVECVEKYWYDDAKAPLEVSEVLSVREEEEKRRAQVFDINSSIQTSRRREVKAARNWRGRCSTCD